jgi:RNA polymerase-binding transcription factor DksA
LLTARYSAGCTGVAALERELGGIIESSGSASTDDEHDPEGATIAFERQHVAALLERERDQQAAAERALRKVDDGSYGVCEACGQPIAAERLAARPAAATCISCAARRR